jgi:hypothetical protein
MEPQPEGIDDMAFTVARCTVKPGLEERNAELVRAVYSELSALSPTGFRYATYRLDDGRTFVHVAELDAGSENPLTSLKAFGEFQAGIRERCEQGPEVGGAELVGRFSA